MIKGNAAHHQFIKFAIVGVVSNGILYLLYLLLTYMGVGHKLAMTLLFITGLLQTFVFNKKWAFQHDGATRKTFVRYGIVYVSAYLINLAALIVLTDNMGFPHELVQGGAILVVAVYLFVMQKLWVFKHR